MKRTFSATQIMSACLLLASLTRAEAEGVPPASQVQQASSRPLAVWDTLIRVSQDGGYRDNVLRTSVAPESSPFIHSSAEISLLRLSEDGSQASFFVLGEDWRYTDAPSVNGEQLVSALAQGLWTVAPDVEAGGEAQYLYQHQVVDVSEDDASLRRLLVEGHSFLGRPRMKWSLSPLWYAQAEGFAARQVYNSDDLDDYWEPAARLNIGFKYAKSSELSFGVQTAMRMFDNREQSDISGTAIPNTSLQYWRPEAGLQLRHYWDSKRHWRTTTKLSYLCNRDNGAGYYDYDRVLVSQYLRWAQNQWEFRLGARFGWYSYPVQQVDGELRERSYYVVDLRVERKFGKHFFVYAAGEGEWDISNDPLDEYQDWAGSAGVGLEF